MTDEWYQKLDGPGENDMMMIRKLQRTKRLLIVSAAFGLAALSAASEANIRPIPMSQCERDVRSWCYWYGGDYYFDYDLCVSSEWLRRCQEVEPAEYSTRDPAILD